MATSKRENMADSEHELCVIFVRHPANAYPYMRQPGFGYPLGAADRHSWTMNEDTLEWAVERMHIPLEHTDSRGYARLFVLLLLPLLLLSSSWSTADDIDGEALYLRYCDGCHGEDPHAAVDFFPSLVESARTRDPRAMINTILTGKFDRGGEMNGHTIPLMPTWDYLATKKSPPSSTICWSRPASPSGSASRTSRSNAGWQTACARR